MRLIDADKLKAHFAWWNDENKDIFNSIINQQPTVDPVKRGRWVDDYNAEEFPLFRKGWKCSACGFRTSYGKPKYCMNCGARMDGENDEID